MLNWHHAEMSIHHHQRTYFLGIYRLILPGNRAFTDHLRNYILSTEHGSISKHRHDHFKRLGSLRVLSGTHA